MRLLYMKQQETSKAEDSRNTDNKVNNNDNNMWFSDRIIISYVCFVVISLTKEIVEESLGEKSQ